MNSLTEAVREKPVLEIHLYEVLPEYQEEFHAAYGTAIYFYDKTPETFLSVKDTCPQLWQEIERIIIKKGNKHNDISTKV